MKKCKKERSGRKRYKTNAIMKWKDEARSQLKMMSGEQRSMLIKAGSRKEDARLMSSIGKDRIGLHRMIAASAIRGKELDKRSVCDVL